jgi:hypothetical protein
MPLYLRRSFASPSIHPNDAAATPPFQLRPFRATKSYLSIFFGRCPKLIYGAPWALMIGIRKGCTIFGTAFYFIFGTPN